MATPSDLATSKILTYFIAAPGLQLSKLRTGAVMAPGLQLSKLRSAAVLAPGLELSKLTTYAILGKPMQMSKLMAYAILSPSGSLSMTDLVVTQEPTSSPNEITLRYSDTGGASWSNGVTQSLGEVGQFDVDVQFRRLGMSRNRVIEISWSGDCQTALMGCFIQYEVAET